MKPMGAIPPYFTANEAGQLLIGGEPVEDLVAEAGGTPLFVYDNNIAGTQIARFRAAMPSGVSLYYVVTANPYEPLLSFICRYVEGFRVVSGGELELLEDANLHGIPINFAGPGKSDAELRAAISAGATISIESECEAARAIRAGEQLRVKPSLAVRVSPEFVLPAGRTKRPGPATPFGVDPENVPDLVRGLIEAGVDWRGLHIFSAWQCHDSAELIDLHKGTVSLAGEIAEAIGMPLPELNLGGGFGFSSIAGEEPIDVDAVASALTQTLCSANDMLATTRFAMELGRWLVAPAGVYLTRVIDRKESGGRTFVVTDGGGHHLLDATGCLGEPGHNHRALAVANRFGSPAEEEVTVTGCLCTPFDIFADGVSLPYTEPGDLIAIFGAGAYGPTASPQRWESRPPAREMLV
jgi:diaminopimelate decarboxylase